MSTAVASAECAEHTMFGNGEEIIVPRVLGPTIPKWELGARLRQIRLDRDLDQDRVAEEVGCSTSKVQKIEAGDVRTSRGDLRIIMDLLDVGEPLRSELVELQRQGEQRGWWARFGKLPDQFATYLDLEQAAESMKTFEPLLVHGLLQTEEYARAIAGSVLGPIPSEQVDQQVQIRLGRQEAFQERLSTESPLRLWAVLDEAVLHRAVGGTDVMAGQLRRLLDLPRHHVTLQVVPFDAGSYAGLNGAATIFEFDPDLHSPVVYAEIALGAVYAERAHEIAQATMRYNHITASALSPERSRELIRDVADTL